MGTWGYAITQDDVVCDIIAAFQHRLKRGQSIAQATAETLVDFAEALADDDDGPLVWIALAEAQWEYGQLDFDILSRVKKDLMSGAGLASWRETSEKDLAKRQESLEHFVAKLERPNPHPRKFPRIVVRKPKYAAGDCLAISLSNGQFGAALVLAADHSNEEYGKNLIGVLDYLSESQPGLAVFEQRHWLRLTHHSWAGALDIAWHLPVRFRKERRRFEVIGNVKILGSDPKDSAYYVGWQGLGEQALLQRRWEEGTQ